MAEFKTPTSKKLRSKLIDGTELQTPIKIPASPFLEQIGYGCGVNVFTLERSPKVGFTRSPWAIKKRNRKIEESQKYNDRIRFEAEILRKLSHPNIVGFRAFTESPNGEPCLAMEKLDTSLGDMIERKVEEEDDPFPANDILTIAYEIIKGLEYLHHTALILHGDIKSYNILISRNYKIVKLCDFGVSLPLTKSLQIDKSKGNFTYIGTECWSAPEIIFEDGPITNKADMWAFGLVIWEMIALSPPHAETLEDSAEECSFNDTRSTDELSSPVEDCQDTSSLNESITFLKEMMNNKYGTRPPLPAIKLGPEYQKPLEIFFACTTPDHSIRPSAKGLLKYFQNYVFNDKK